jgi:hypothetical protein
MYGMNDLFQMVVAVLKEADAKNNLTKYLHTKIRPEFLEKVKIDSILNPLIHKAEAALGHGIDGGLFKEDLVDMLIDKDVGDELLGLLLSNAKRKGLENKEERQAVVHGGVLGPELRKKVVELQDDLGKIAYDFLNKTFQNRMLIWVHEHKKEAPAEQGEGKEPAVLDEKELEKEIREEYSWEEGLIKDVLALINEKVNKEHQAMYKLILKDRFLVENKKSLEDIANRVQMSTKSVELHEKKLAEMLKVFFKAQGLGPKFDPSEKEIEIPPMEEILKIEENKKDFKDFLMDKAGERASEQTRKILEMLTDGKSIGDIVTELDVPRSTVGSIKNRYFDSAYEEWYKDMVEDARKVCARMIQAVKTVRVKKELTPEQKEKKEKEQEKGVTKVHETMVNQAIEHHRIRVLVSFSANYDNMSPESEKKEDADFKWIHYEATLNESRRGPEKDDGTRPEWSVDYKYSHDLKEDGMIADKGISSLKVDGKEVAKEHPLTRYIDDHLEKVVLKEGAIPHGKFPVEYVNTKTKKHYHGTHDFLKMYDNIVVPDTAHENRLLEEQRFKTKKQLGPSLDVGEKAEIHELIKDLEHQNKSEDDPENKRRIKDHIQQLKDLLEMKGGKDLDEIEDIINQEKLIRKPTEVHSMDYDQLGIEVETSVDYDTVELLRGHTKFATVFDDASFYDEIPSDTLIYKMATVFPGPQSEGAKVMLDLFKGYGLTSKPNPSLWLVPSDLIVLAKSLRSLIEAKLQKEMKAKKPKGMGKEEFQEDLKRIEGLYKKEVEDARKHFPAFIEDLKTRRDKFEQDNAKEFAEWSKGKNLSWVDNESEVEKLTSRIKDELGKTPTFEKEQKEPGIKMLEKTKWNSLQGFLRASQHGFITLGNTLKKAPLEPGLSKETTDQLRQNFVDMNKEYMDLRKTIRELVKEETAEEKKQLLDFETEVVGLSKDLQFLEGTIKSGGKVPAILAAEALKAYSAYFSRLYSIYSGILWFKEKYSEKEEEPAAPPSPEEKKKNFQSQEIEMNRLKDSIVQQSKDVAETDLKAKDSIKTSVARMRASLTKFIEGMRDLGKLRPEAAVTSAEDDSYEKRLKEYIFPGHLLQEAEGVIKKLRDHRKEAVEPAEKEFKEIVHNILTAFKDKERFEEKTEEVAKKKGITKEKAAIQLKKHEEALAKAAIDTFILKWSEIDVQGEKKEKSPLGNKHHTEYDRIGKYVKDHLPDLYKHASPEKENLPKPGIATPKEIRETIEHLWTLEREPTPEELTKLYKLEGDKLFGGGGGGGGKSGRPKAPKAPVPSAVYETIKDDIGKLITHKSAEDVVLTVMALYTKRVRDAMKGLKEGEYLDVGDIIDGFVYLLKNIQNMIGNLNTHPSARGIESPRHGIGAPSMSGTPDIPIDNYKETVALFDKIKDIYEEINHYIAPDKVGVPPESLKNLSKATIRKYLPRGMVEWAQWFSENEGKAPQPKKEDYERMKAPKPEPPETTKAPGPRYTGHASTDLGGASSQLSLNVAMKFAGIPLPQDDDFEAILK